MKTVPAPTVVSFNKTNQTLMVSRCASGFNYAGGVTYL